MKASSTKPLYSFYQIPDPNDTENTGAMVDFTGDLTEVASKVEELLASTPSGSISVVQVLDMNLEVLIT